MSKRSSGFTEGWGYALASVAIGWALLIAVLVILGTGMAGVLYAVSVAMGWTA